MSRAKTIITCIENILPNFAVNIKHGITGNHHTVFTNKYVSTLSKNQNEIQEIKNLKNSTFIYNYESAIEILKIEQQQNNTVLVVGDPHPHLYEQLSSKRVITLQEICALYPQKVPLSYRSKDVQTLKQKLQKRVGIKLEQEPTFSHVLLTSSNIKMWDEAIQVVLDCHPSHIIVEYEHEEQSKSGLYKLTMTDFVQALGVCHKIVHSQEKMPRFTNFNTQNLHIEWIINKLKAQGKANGWIVVDEELVNNRDELTRKGHDVERIDQNSQLWG